MELRYLEAFVAIAETLSFSAASDRLHIVQSSVSANIRRLEQELGTPVFERRSRQVVLTDAGRALLPQARATLASAQAALEAVQQVRGGLRGTVTLGMIQDAALVGLDTPRLLSAFRCSHREVALHVRHGPSAQMAEQVREGTLDFALLAHPGGPAPGLDMTLVSRQTMVIGVAASHRIASSAGVELSTLVDEVFADGPPEWGTRILADRAFLDAGLTRRVTVETNDTATLLSFVRYGLAIALVAPSFAGENDGIALVPVDPDAPIFETFIAAPVNRRLGAAATALLALMRSSVSQAQSTTRAPG